MAHQSVSEKSKTHQTAIVQVQQNGTNVGSLGQAAVYNFAGNLTATVVRNKMTVTGAGSTTPYGVASGTNTYIVTLGLSSYTTGQLVVVKFTNANTSAGAIVLNSDGLGNKFIKFNGANPVIGFIAAGSTVDLVYNGTNFDIIGETSTLPVTTKGDLLGFDTAPNRVPVGADGLVLTADSTNALGVSYKVPSAAGVSQFLVLGDGVDGAVVMDGTNTFAAFTTKVGNVYTLTRDIYPSSLTITSPGSLVTKGFKVRISGNLDLTGATAAGSINYNGTVGTNASGVSGGGAAAGLTVNTVGGSQTSPTGLGGGVTTGNTGTAAAANPRGFGGNTVTTLSGAGGAGSSGSGGAGHAGATNGVPNPLRVFQNELFHWAVGTATPTIINGGSTGSSGGSGGGDGAAGGGGSGSGGVAGGVVYLMCNTLVTGGSTVAGAIQCVGGVGGNGGVPAGGNRGGGGGAQAGAGGWMYFGYFARSGSAVTNLIDASGGVGGTGGAATGTGVAGSGGGGADGGRIQSFNFATNTLTEVLGAAGGAAGGVGVVTAGTAGSCKLTV